jgi:hypothetical protein
MNTANINPDLIDHYFTLLKSLSPNSKLELIARLSKSMKTTNKAKEISLKSLFGAWESEQSAEELVQDLKNARNFNRNREEL